MRLAAHLIGRGVSLTVFTSKAAFATIQDAGIRIDSGHVVFVDSALAARVLGPRGALRLGLLGRVFPSLLSGRYRHVHLVHDPGNLSTLFARLSSLIPPFSLTVADSRHSYGDEHLPPLVKAAAVDCLSEDIADHVRRHLPRPDGPAPTESLVKVAPCSFADYPAVIPPYESRGIDVVFAARFTTGKGLDLLERMEPLPTGISLHVLGQPASGPDGFTPTVDGAEVYFAPNLPSVLGRARVFLSLQDEENYPSQSLLEAMSVGCAVVATDVGLTRKLVDETTGLLIPRSPKALREAILRLTDDPAWAESLGAAGAVKVRAEHTIDRFADYFIDEVLTGS